MSIKRDLLSKLQCSQTVEYYAVVERRNGSRKSSVCWDKITAKCRAVEKHTAVGLVWCQVHAKNKIRVSVAISDLR